MWITIYQYQSLFTSIIRFKLFSDTDFRLIITVPLPLADISMLWRSTAILAICTTLAASQRGSQSIQPIKSLVDQSIINDQTQATQTSVQQILLDDIFPSSDKAGNIKCCPIGTSFDGRDCVFVESSVCPQGIKPVGSVCVAEVRIGGAPFFLFGNVPRGTPLGSSWENITFYFLFRHLLSRHVSKATTPVPSQKKQLLTPYLRIAGLSNRPSFWRSLVYQPPNLLVRLVQLSMARLASRRLGQFAHPVYRLTEQTEYLQKHRSVLPIHHSIEEPVHRHNLPAALQRLPLAGKCVSRANTLRVQREQLLTEYCVRSERPQCPEGSIWNGEVCFSPQPPLCPV
jgi:hypothetical protein